MTVNSVIASELLSITPTQFGMVVANGFIPAQPDGRYLVRDCVAGYLRYRLDSGQQERRERDSRLAQIKIAERSLHLAERRGQLFNLSASVAFLNELCGELFGMIDGVPAEYSRDLKERKRLAAILDRVRITFAELVQKKMAKFTKSE
jgi:hypothetical protein